MHMRKERVPRGKWRPVEEPVEDSARRQTIRPTIRLTIQAKKDELHDEETNNGNKWFTGWSIASNAHH